MTANVSRHVVDRWQTTELQLGDITMKHQTNKFFGMSGSQLVSRMIIVCVFSLMVAGVLVVVW